MGFRSKEKLRKCFNWAYGTVTATGTNASSFLVLGTSDGKIFASKDSKYIGLKQ